MNEKIYLKYLSLMLFIGLFLFFSKSPYIFASEEIKHRAKTTQLGEDRNYNPVEAYGGSIIYAIPPGGAIAHVEFDQATHRIDYTDQIDSAVDFWRAFIRNVYPQLSIRRVRLGEQANFFIGHSSSLNMIAGRAGIEPAISYIPQTNYLNTIALRSNNLVNRYGIYIDNFIVEMNENRMEFIMRTFSDVHNRGEAVKRYMYILLVRHLGYALGFVPNDSNISLFGNIIPWYSPEIYYISLNDSATPRLMYRNNTFDYIEDLVRFNSEEDAFTINDIRISPQEEIVARMCLYTGELAEKSEKDSKLYQLCNTRIMTYPLIARMILTINKK
ncbi:hypothetical protein BDD26_3110 [Xenorhabdus cabanillasii]|uniref:Uncharacterized protein n=1 Tax=Xenorhabdus cabanillasii TaxID=351673 RepID=A0A3D9UU36_9GAMM|nr:hypothetical protein [Xenorhabdus cabanillasii]REF28231.1 hypothetical protein BDD26_3110 [Xenorhabdus cabanillasii]